VHVSVQSWVWRTMKPAAPHGLLLSSLCLALCCLGGARGSRRSDNHEWKKLIMVHHWPVTVCKEVENDCRDPPDYWTIHGLWQALAPFTFKREKTSQPKSRLRLVLRVTLVIFVSLFSGPNSYLKYLRCLYNNPNFVVA